MHGLDSTGPGVKGYLVQAAADLLKGTRLLVGGSRPLEGGG